MPRTLCAPYPDAFITIEHEGYKNSHIGFHRYLILFGRQILNAVSSKCQNGREENQELKTDIHAWSAWVSVILDLLNAPHVENGFIKIVFA